MGSSNSPRNFTYSAPNPFALPTVEARQSTFFVGGLEILNAQSPQVLIPREGLEYSSSVLEEIMANITAEAKERGNSLPKWRRYKTGSDGRLSFKEFTNPSKSGENLKGEPVEFFALLVRDIQGEIEKLVNQLGFGDNLASYLARIFANNTICNGSVWNAVTKLPTTININTSDGVQVINLFQKAQSGQWPFTAELLGKVVSIMGVMTTDPKRQNAEIGQDGEAGQIEVTDPNFPQSPYGKVTPSGVPGTVPKFKMTEVNRTVYNRVNIENSSLGVGKDLEDPDMGYGYLTTAPHAIQQLRFQPPSIETFPNIVGIQDYASNLISNTSPNIAYLQSLPVETQIFENWGFWLIKGQVGVTGGGASLRAFNNPSAAAAAVGNCPYSVFFPPPSSNCSCSTGDDAYFIWHATKTGFIWDELNLIQSARAQPRQFGRHTRLAVDASLSGGAGGSQTKEAFFGVGIRTARISNVNLQPFHYVLAKYVEGHPNISTAMQADTGLDVPIMDNLHTILGNEYRVGGLDNILAMQILLFTRSSAKWTCAAQDGPNGSFLPASCFTVETCNAGSFSAVMNSVRLYEPPLVGDPVSAYA